MSGTLTNTQLSALSSAALTASRTASSSSTSAAAAVSASSGSSGATSSSSASSSSGALGSLTSNYNDFLTLFTTQLQDQDPDSPMDSDQFTTELVQFSGVEQQVQTNSNLTQLIQLTQAQDLSQGSGEVGKNVSISGNVMPLQSGSATVNFDTPSAEPVAISITNSSGVDVKDVTLTSSAGANSWSWNGQSNTGVQEPDGAYNVSVMTGDSSGDTTAVPFTSTGTVTGVAKSGSSVDYSFGGMSLDESDIGSLSN